MGLGIKERFKKFRDRLVIDQVAKAKLPVFDADEVVRVRIVFSGRVQKVGFRLEVSELAKRLGITGCCENLDNGDVCAELQGQKNRIEFLVEFMHSLKRMKITRMDWEVLPVVDGETAFVTG